MAMSTAENLLIESFCLIIKFSDVEPTATLAPLRDSVCHLLVYRLTMKITLIYIITI